MGAPVVMAAGLFARAANWFAVSKGGQFASSVLHNPFVSSGQFGLGYTSAAYLGYGATNTWDPFGLHKPKYKYYQHKLRLPYGSYGRRYGGYTRRYNRFSRRYRGFRRRSYYRRRYY